MCFGCSKKPSNECFLNTHNKKKEKEFLITVLSECMYIRSCICTRYLCIDVYIITLSICDMYHIRVIRSLLLMIK